MATFTEMLFYEYFHADNATGLGASHQTDSTGIIAKLTQMLGETARPAGVAPVPPKPARKPASRIKR